MVRSMIRKYFKPFAFLRLFKNLPSAFPSSEVTACHRSHALGNRAYTLIELMIVIVIIGILAGIAIAAFNYYVKRAYDVTIKHDLKEFATAEENYLIAHDRYIGQAGDYIQGGNPVTGTLVSSDFPYRPSEGVKISIISGDGSDPQGATAFIAQGDHDKSTKRYAHNFKTGQMTAEEK